MTLPYEYASDKASFGVDDGCAPELGVPEPGAGTVAGDEVVVVSLLDDAVVRHHRKEIRVADRRETVGDHEAGAPTLYALGADRWRLAGDQRQRPFQ